MKKIKCVIMDWAGTAVDYGCFAPVAAFIEAFAEKGLIIDVVQTRKPMGLPKIQHIRELLSMPEVNEQFATRYQRAWTEEDVVELNRLFEKHLFASLENYTDPIPGVIPTLEKLRASWRTKDGNFSLHGLMGFDMHGKTAGIIGTGKIAKILIHILKGFGMNILAYDLYPDYNFAREEKIVYTSLDELYHSSDIISLHCPLTEATKYLINDYSISKMKDGVMIINTGRGQLIHTNALIEGLKNKKIGSAGLDVYEEESEYFYEDQSDRIIDDDVLARLLSFNNVIVTSHQAFFTHEALENIAMTTLQNIRDFINHKPLLNEVKK